MPLLQELLSSHSHFILLEDKVDFIAAQQGDKVVRAYAADKGAGKPKLSKKAKTILGWIASHISKKQLQWVVNRYIDGNFSLEDHARVATALVRFEKLRNKLEKKDISSYKSLAKLEDSMEPFSEADEVSNNEQDRLTAKKFIDEKEAEVFYDKDGLKIIVPKTEEASCFFGRGTKWCTAAEKNNMFSSYDKLYIVMANKRKFQFHMKTRQFMDERDAPLSSDEKAELLKSHPVIKTLFGAEAKKNGVLWLMDDKDITKEYFAKVIRKADQRDVIDMMASITARGEEAIREFVPVFVAEWKHSYLGFNASIIEAMTDEQFNELYTEESEIHSNYYRVAVAMTYLIIIGDIYPSSTQYRKLQTTVIKRICASADGFYKFISEITSTQAAEFIKALVEGCQRANLEDRVKRLLQGIDDKLKLKIFSEEGKLLDWIPASQELRYKVIDARPWLADEVKLTPREKERARWAKKRENDHY